MKRGSHIILGLWPKNRNPWRNGHTLYEWHTRGVYAESFRFLLHTSTWRRHLAPFAKSRRAQARRAVRKFIIHTKRSFLYVD